MALDQLSERIKRFWDKWETIQNHIKKQYHDDEFAYEAFSFALEHIQSNNWAALKKKKTFRSKKELDSYLFIVIKNACIEYYRKIYGRNHIPKWIKAMGPIWETVYKKICLEGFSVTDLLNHFRQTCSNSNVMFIVEDALSDIVNREKICGKKKMRDENADIETIMAQNVLNYIDLEKIEFIRLITSFNSQSQSILTGEQITKKIQRFEKLSKLSTEELFLLKQIYHSGLTIKKAGENMGWSENQTRYRHKQLIMRIKDALHQAGLYDELKDSLMSEKMELL
jgi:RNA polymerase sigma factor (sigma-70 family)